ncbi:MAG: pilus assembly protein N-terminal domain-containing protein [Rubripirellula sp.]
MRKQRRTFASQSKSRRRAVIALFVMATTPVMADGPQSNALPPLPLTRSVQANPFCADQSQADSKIQLASGSTASTIRLKPIGTAVGLQSIADSKAIKRIKPSAMTIEEVAPTVQQNPLIGSQHHSNTALVNVNVESDDFQSSSNQAAAKNRSTIVLIPPVVPEQPAPFVQRAPLQQPAPAPVQQMPVAPAPAPQQPVLAVQPSPPAQIVQAPTVQAPVMQAPAVQAPVATPASEVVAAVVESAEPVYFSMSDRFSSPASSTTEAPAEQAVDVAHSETPVVEVAAGVPVEPELIVDVEEGAAVLIQEVDDSASAVEEPAKLAVDSATPIEMEGPDESSLQPINSVLEADAEEPTAVYGSAPIVSAPVKAAEATLHTQRYRPPVAVKALPLAFGRSPEEAPAVASLQAAKELDLDGFGSSLEKKTKLTPLYMSQAQVRSLTLGGSVRKVKVANENVCQAVASGPNQLKLIGLGRGVTRLVVWADTDNADKPTRMRAFEVHVKDTVETTGETVGNKTAMLNQSIHKAFPGCEVRVRQVGNELVVSGRCDSETSAKKIMRMVRSTCLVPTRDELVVQ